MSKDERSRDVMKIEADKTQCHVAEIYYVFYGVKNRLWNRYVQAEDRQRRPTFGCPRCTTVREDIFANVSKDRSKVLFSLVLNFREEKADGSLIKLLLIDLTKQILKLVDQLYAPY